MAELAVTACHQCRAQKLKCSRELPQCGRCARLRRACVYPEPPDRKYLASIRRTALRRQRPPETIGADLSFQDILLNGENWPQKAAIDVGDGDMPSEEVQSMLIDTYFTFVFNSAMVFHKPTVMRQWRAKQLSTTVLLAICAMATRFQAQPSRVANCQLSDCTPRKDLAAAGRRWALLSGEMVLNQMHVQSSIKQDHVQTCSILYLYWFSLGELDRHDIFISILWKRIRALVLDRPEDESHRISSEPLRRLFWAAWMAHCIAIDHYMPGMRCEPQVLCLPLPISKTAFIEGLQESPQTIEATNSQTLGSYNRELTERPSSVAAELLRLIFLWAKIRDHIAMKMSLTMQEAMCQLFALDKDLSEWRSTLPASMGYSKRALYQYLVVNGEPAYFDLHACYYQCVLALHSSYVPLLSGTPMLERLPQEIVHSCARSAMDNAKLLSNLAGDLFALDWDPATLAPFTGYAMYVSAATLLSPLAASANPAYSSNESDALLTIRLLNAMRPHWKHLSNLWSRLLLLYKAHISSRKHCIDSESITSGYDAYVWQPRKLDRFPEPISDSYLHYGLKMICTPIAEEQNAANLCPSITDDDILKQLTTLPHDPSISETKNIISDEATSNFIETLPFAAEICWIRGEDDALDFNHGGVVPDFGFNLDENGCLTGTEAEKEVFNTDREELRGNSTWDSEEPLYSYNFPLI